MQQQPPHGQSHPLGVLRSLFPLVAGALAIPVLLLSLIFLFASCSPSSPPPGGNTSPNASVQLTSRHPTASTQIAPEPSPTQIPTPTPIPTKAVSGTPLLGAHIDTFRAKYGEPQASGLKGHYVFNGAPHLDVTTNSDQLVVALVVTPGQGFPDQQAAISACLAFAPDDASYQKNADYEGGIQRLYQSAKLASMLPASSFRGQNLEPTEPGTFGLTLHPDGSQVLSCSVQTTLEV